MPRREHSVKVKKSAVHSGLDIHAPRSLSRTLSNEKKKMKSKEREVAIEPAEEEDRRERERESTYVFQT